MRTLNLVDFPATILFDGTILELVSLWAADSAHFPLFLTNKKQKLWASVTNLFKNNAKPRKRSCKKQISRRGHKFWIEKQLVLRHVRYFWKGCIFPSPLWSPSKRNHTNWHKTTTVWHKQLFFHQIGGGYFLSFCFFDKTTFTQEKNWKKAKIWRLISQ